ncbi:GL22825 [Drosophila persimilis]|uniref:GL22825 n=1 Tax=Drosophila persimilis TaxID=7234 RepID=B4GZJ2_DROPE|nr:GL22825 [Drosophila persimilis]
MSHLCAPSVMKAVLCVGCTEVAYVTNVERFPEKGSRVQCQSAFMQRNGRTSNVCTALRLLGARVELFGMLSRLGTFRMVLDDLRRRDIVISNCSWTDESPKFSTIIRERRTGTCTVVRCTKAFPYVTAREFEKLDLSPLLAGPQKLEPPPVEDSERSSESEDLTNEQRTCRKYLNRPFYTLEPHNSSIHEAVVGPEPESEPMSEDTVKAAWERLSKTAY